MPTIEYKPEIKPVEIDDTFFQELIDPERRIDANRPPHRGAIHYTAAIAARLVADAFFAGMDYVNQEYREAFRTELRGFLRESDVWQDWIRVTDEIISRLEWDDCGEGLYRCPACGKPKSELHAEGCVLRKRLLCDMDDVGYRPAPDHSQSPRYAGREKAE